MNERSSKNQKKEHDFNLTAFRVVQEATGLNEESKTPAEESQGLTPEERHAVAVGLGRLGGKKGGPARAAKLSPEERKEFARKAASARWQRTE